MAEKEPTQKTPAGLEIPVPTRSAVDDALAKVAKPQVSSRKRKRGAKK